jgi:hypothetical protein
MKGHLTICSKAKRNQGLFTDQAAAELIGCECNCLPELRLICENGEARGRRQADQRAMLHSCDLSCTWFSSRGVGPSEAAVVATGWQGIARRSNPEIG